MTNSTHRLMVKRCCPPGNKLGCQLWTVQDHMGYGLGKFGTRTGAMNFALVVSRRKPAVRTGQGNEEITLESVSEVEQV